jgi:hypothetical protein
MALRMIALDRAADGRWFARKVIPQDVREEYKSLYGLKREAHLKLPADTPRHEAKAKLGEWVSEVENRIATLRARQNGHGQPLTRNNAYALAGRWYNWFIAQHENDPGPSNNWGQLWEIFVDFIRDEAPASYEEDPRSDPKAVRPHAADIGQVASFLANEGIALNASAYALFVDAVSDNLLSALPLLEKRAKGDYSRDDIPDTFPQFKDGPVRASGVSCWELFEAYVKAVKPAPNTIARWRPVLREMQREFADVGADGITEEAARTWIHGLSTEKRTCHRSELALGIAARVPVGA